MSISTAKECFINLKYRHNPTPNFWKEESGSFAVQQQKRPGSMEQQDSQHPYFSIPPVYVILCGYRGLMCSLLNYARLSGSSLRLSSSLLKALYNNLEAYHTFLSYISIRWVWVILLFLFGWNQLEFFV